MGTASHVQRTRSRNGSFRLRIIVPNGFRRRGRASRRSLDRMSVGTFSVLHVGKFYPPHRGGMESHLELVCQGLRRNCDVQVVVANDGPNTVVDHLEGVSVARIGSLGNLAGTP